MLEDKQSPKLYDDKEAVFFYHYHKGRLLHCKHCAAYFATQQWEGYTPQYSTHNWTECINSTYKSH